MKIDYKKYPALGFKFNFEIDNRLEIFFKEHFISPKEMSFKIYSRNYHKAILDFDENHLEKLVSSNPGVFEELPDTVGGILNFSLWDEKEFSILYRKKGTNLYIFNSYKGVASGFSTVNLNSSMPKNRESIKKFIASRTMSDGNFMTSVVGYVLASLIFERYAKLEDKVYKAHMKKPKTPLTQAEENNTGVDVTFRNITWYTNIYRTDGFKVRGHFRLQPKKNKNGEWIKELIWINEFEKHGYTRVAGKVREEGA